MDQKMQNPALLTANWKILRQKTNQTSKMNLCNVFVCTINPISCKYNGPLDLNVVLTVIDS